MPSYNSEMLSKSCTKCKITKPLSEFHKNKAFSDGHTYECKSCRSLRSKEYVRRPEVRERRSSYQKVHYANNKELYSKKHSRWYEKNKVAITEAKRIRISETKQKCLDYLGSKCCKCGYNNSMKALHFHHIDPLSKEDKLSSLIGLNKSWEILKEELDKCVILCANCHAEEHDEDYSINERIKINGKL